MVNSRGRCFHGPLHSIGALHRGGCEKRCLDGEYRADARKVVEANGGKVVDSYSTLGRYDLVAVVEAPDNATMMKISALLARRVPVRAETLPAVPSPDFAKSVSGAK